MNIPKISALFESSLASALSASGSSFTLVSATDRDGNALSGRYGFIIDEGSADEEFVIGTVSGTTVTIEYRGIDADAPNTEVSANKKVHRRGASVKITDYPILGVLRNLMAGDDTIPAPIKYASGVAPSTADDLADKGYVDGVAIAGGADASTTVKGISKMSVAPASATNPIAVGDNDPRVPTQGENDALVGNDTSLTVGSGNKMVTQTGLQRQAESYAVATGSSNAYSVSLSPAPAALTAGFVLRMKANFSNTGAATVAVNGGSAIAIKKTDGATALASGDIASGEVVTLVYDGTNWQLQTPIATASLVYKNGTTTRALNSVSSTQNIAHGLGVTPKFVRLTIFVTGTSTTLPMSHAVFVYNGTTVSGVYQNYTINTSPTDQGTGVGSTITLGTAANGHTGTITFDGTNISIAWTLVGSGQALTAQILWEAYA